MLRLTNTVLPMHPDRLYASEGSTQATYTSARQDINSHQAWQNKLTQASCEDDILAQLNPNGSAQHQQHGIDTYVLHVYIHERHHPPFTSLTYLIGSTLTLSFDTPSGLHYRHLYLTAVHQLDHDGSYGYYRLLAQPLTYRLHQHPRCHVDTDLSVQSMVAERTATLEIETVDDSSSEDATDWTPARMTQWQISDWTHICERLARQGLTAYLRHEQTDEHSPPKLIITTAYPSDSEGISANIGAIRYQQVLHDRVHAPVLALTEQVITQPSSVTMQRFNSASVTHPTQSADITANTDQENGQEDNQAGSQTLTLDTPAAFAPVTDTETINEATVVANSHQSHYSVYHALAHATDLNVADTFILVDHNHLNQHYRATHIVHLARNSLAHVTGLTISCRHHERHASTLESGIHLTQLRLITADTPWVGSLYSKRVLPPMTGITDAQSDTDSRNHMTPTKSYLLDSPAQPINRLEAQAGANYGSHFTHRTDDQTLMQSIGDGEHLINTGSLLSSTRPSLFATDNEQAVESGYRNTGNGLSEWITDHRTEQAYSQLNVDDGQVAASLKMGIINAASDGASSKRQGINANTNAQINIKSGEALVFSTQPQTHAQSEQHNYQQHTPTLTQTALGGQHLAERLTQLATGLGRQVNDHKAIKTQLESIAEEQQTKTHQQAPYTLIDSAADTSYVSDDTLIQRSMGEMITTTQQDMMVSSGDGHHQVSSESLTMVADGQFSMTNGKDNIMLSAHTGKLEATAKQDVNMSSSTKEVEIVATNKITLTAGGASITLDGGDITIAAMQFTEKAGKHSRDGGGMDGLGLNKLPDALLAMFDEQLNLKNDFGDILANIPYKLILDNGDIIEGITDILGNTQRIITNKEVSINRIELGVPTTGCCSRHSNISGNSVGSSLNGMIYSIAQDLLGVSTNSANIGNSLVPGTIKDTDNNRGLTTNEIALLQRFFKSSLDYSKIRIKTTNLMQEYAGLTPFGNIWLDPDTCLSDFGNLYTYQFTKDDQETYDGKFDFYGAVALQKMMIHECVHAWQHQQGISVFFKGLWLKLDLDFHNEYQYHLEPNKKLKNFNIEAQASLIEDYIFITLYRNSLSDDKLAVHIRENGYNNRQQLFSGSISTGYTFRPNQFTLMQDVLSEFIADPNNCL